MLDLLLGIGVIISSANESLGSVDRVHRVGHCLVLGGLPNQLVSVLIECNDGGGCALALSVLDHFRLTALDHGHARVSRPEIDTDSAGRK